MKVLNTGILTYVNSKTRVNIILLPMCELLKNKG